MPGYTIRAFCINIFVYFIICFLDKISFAVVFQGKKEDTIITAREYDRKARGEVRAGSAVSRERMLSQ